MIINLLLNPVSLHYVECTGTKKLMLVPHNGLLDLKLWVQINLCSYLIIGYFARNLCEVHYVLFSVSVNVYITVAREHPQCIHLEVYKDGSLSLLLSN